jgi:hypothetical protein
MVKFSSVLRNCVILVSVTLIAGYLLNSCKKNDTDTSTPPNSQYARIMAFNLAPDEPSIGFSASGNFLTSAAVGFGDYTGDYKNVNIGEMEINTFEFASPSSPISSLQAKLDINRFYSVFFVGVGSNHKSLFVRDYLDTLSGDAGKAYVRYINAITDSLTDVNINITGGATNYVDENAAYGKVSDFKGVNPGEISIAIKSNNGIDTSKTLSVDLKRVYTILLTGTPGSVSAPVDIKYIINGRVKDPVQ